MNIALLGPSGAGKGTHIPRLKEQFELVHVSTGDLLRENLNRKTALGLLAKKFVAQGELVPDEIVNAMIEEKVQQAPPGKGIVFDGFPRTTHQAKFLNTLMSEAKRSLDAVIYIAVFDDEIVRRLSGRLICRECLAPFHQRLKLFTACPYQKCSGEHLFQRTDDTPEMVRIRLRMFHRASGPLVDFYQKAGQLIILDGEKDSTIVGDALIRTVESIIAGQSRFATVQEISQIQHPTEFVPRLQVKQKSRASMDLALLGAPGCGKGTQAHELSEHFNLRHISSGELFREHLKSGTDLGKLAKGFLEQGELVPNEITDAMLSERLSQPDTTDGFILDGYPRTLHQAEALDETLASLGRELVGVLYILVSDADIVNRLSGRLVCRQCQTSFHLRFNPSAKVGLCDVCGGLLYQREDDNPETVKTRLRTFHEQTEPLINYYRQAGLLVEVNGEGDVGRVTAETIAAAKELARSTKFRRLYPGRKPQALSRVMATPREVVSS